ncbi:hypothetical protein ABB37_07834 [Leptomonas pyrrhocoris]|uniref:Uncharacterized protein n=1 Tax=Leptomonas pyrrhocoris TaxID=157538 RepID=A0A0N0DST3_LEPPY|nr:hypothetical protein ABB37_07834 [Leptomonas pyrrhocoris]KPA76542.1 hypothetical protein ABB37_07834 [Leptomonas pyrrhocoris]|eukprot:XP_015654981.1 hypothetical protein ABB37_07834 [Leptomonas pyrrhocoris]
MPENRVTRARRRADIAAQLLMGGVERNPGPRRNNGRRYTNTASTDYDYDAYTDDLDYASGASDGHVLGTHLWRMVARTPAAIPQESSRSSTGHRRQGKNKSARYRESALRRGPRAELREMELTDDGRPAWRTCAQRQAEMFSEMTEYTRYDRDDVNFEVWVAELFADFMTASEAEMRHISLMKEELVVWTLRAVLMADAYDLSMSHISFCPVGGCREFRETVELMDQHVLEQHPSSKRAKQLCREGYSDSYYDVARATYTPQPAQTSSRAPPVKETASSAASSAAPAPPSFSSAHPDPVSMAQQQQSFDALTEQLRNQLFLIDRHQLTVKELYKAENTTSLALQSLAKLRELSDMHEYVVKQLNELIYEKSLALFAHKPRSTVAQVLTQVKRVIEEQQRILDQMTVALASRRLQQCNRAGLTQMYS